MRFFILFVLLCLSMIAVAVSLNKQRDCKCRTELRRGRIIGGRKTDRIYPWMVSLQHKKFDSKVDELRRLQIPIPEQVKIALHFCGGVLINEEWVLTASHCIESKKTDFRVGYGSNDLVATFDRNQYAEVEAAYTHPDFFRTNFADIGLVKLARPLKFSETVQPACLAAYHNDHYDGVLKITGFGVTSQLKEREGRFRGDISPSRYLKEGNTYDVSDDWFFQNKLAIRVRNRDFGELITPCNGDSGGPLHHMKDGRSTVIGIDSTGETRWFGEEKVYCVGNAHYTRVSNYLDWIKETVGIEICL